jgi:hypothetical protein
VESDRDDPRLLGFGRGLCARCQALGLKDDPGLPDPHAALTAVLCGLVR